MGDYIDELIDQFLPQDQENIRETWVTVDETLREAAADVEDRRLAAGSRADDWVCSEWVLKPENVARTCAANFVLAAYVNALWRQMRPRGPKLIQKFLAKVATICDSVRGRYGQASDGSIIN